LSTVFNRSLANGHFPSTFKQAFITPILKKADLDSDDVRSYRSISNLSVISKLLERIVANQLTEYLQRNHLLPLLQSGFRPMHSTETAVLRVLSDILAAVDKEMLPVLILLDLSAAFDTVIMTFCCSASTALSALTVPFYSGSGHIFLVFRECSTAVACR
jgi:hypothetical protein